MLQAMARIHELTSFRISILSKCANRHRATRRIRLTTTSCLISGVCFTSVASTKCLQEPVGSTSSVSASRLPTRLAVHVQKC